MGRPPSAVKPDSGSRVLARVAGIALALLPGGALALLPRAARGDDGAELVERGHYLRARPLVEARASAHPADAEALRLLARIRLAFDQPEAALELAGRAVKLAPKSAPCHQQLAEVCGQMAAEAGGFRALGLARRFHKEARLAAALDSGLKSVRSDLMEFYWRAPGVAGGGKDKARAMADELSRLDRVEGTLASMRLALLGKDTARAEVLMEEALRAGPERYSTHLHAGELHVARGRFAPARQEALAAAAIAPERVGPWTLLAIIEARAGRLAELDSALARAAEIVPDNPAPWYYAARTLIEEGRDLPRAEGYLRRYLAQEAEGFAPTHAHAHWRIAQVLEREGRKPEAIAELDSALQLKPGLEGAKKDLKRLKSG